MKKDISSQRPKSMDWAQRRKWVPHAHSSAVCTLQISSHALCTEPLPEEVPAIARRCKKFWARVVHKGLLVLLKMGSGHVCCLALKQPWFFQWQYKYSTIWHAPWMADSQMTLSACGQCFKVSTFLASLPFTCVAYSHQVWGTLV